MHCRSDDAPWWECEPLTRGPLQLAEFETAINSGLAAIKVRPRAARLTCSHPNSNSSSSSTMTVAICSTNDLGWHSVFEQLVVRRPHHTRLSCAVAVNHQADPPRVCVQERHPKDNGGKAAFMALWQVMT